MRPPQLWTMRDQCGDTSTERATNAAIMSETASTVLSAADLESLFGFTKELAKRAGAIILEGSAAIKSSQAVNAKKNAGQFLQPIPC